MAREHFKKTVLMTSLALLAACGSSKVMTRQDYYTIETGTKTETIVNKYGEPYSITTKKDGTQEYLYIERIYAADVTAEQNNYVLVVKNGVVVSKRYNYTNPPAYDEIYDEDPNDVPN